MTRSVQSSISRSVNINEWSVGRIGGSGLCLLPTAFQSGKCSSVELSTRFNQLRPFPANFFIFLFLFSSFHPGFTIQYNIIQLYCLYVEKFAFWLVIYIKTFNTVNNKTSTTHVALYEVTWLHGCMLYTKRAETAAVLGGTSHVSAVSTPLRWILKNAL